MKECKGNKKMSALLENQNESGALTALFLSSFHDQERRGYKWARWGRGTPYLSLTNVMVGEALVIIIILLFGD